MKLLPQISKTKSNRRRLHILRGMDARLNTELSAMRTAEPPAAALAGTIDAVRVTSPSHFENKPGSRKRLLPRICLGTFLTLGVTVLGYWMHIERTPFYPEGVHLMDQTRTNAYPIYATLVQNVKLDAIARLPHFDKTGNWEDTVRYSSGSDKVALDTPELLLQIADKILQRNAVMMDQTRTLLSLPYFDMSRLEASAEQSEAINYVKLWALFMLEMDTARQRNNDKKAVHAALDALQLATQVQCNTSLVPKMRGMEWEIPVRDYLWEVLPKLDASTLRQVISRLDTINRISRQATVSEALNGELIEGRKVLLDVFGKRNWRLDFALARTTTDTSFAPRNASIPTALASFMESCRYSKQQIYNNYNNVLSYHIAYSSKPYALIKGKNMDAFPSDPISNHFIPAYEGALFSDLITRTQNQLLMTAASISLYKAEQGRYPVSLTDLDAQENNLEKGRRDDLFGNSKSQALFKYPSLRYRRTQNSYVLYSVGPDGKDDGGEPITNKQLNRGNSLHYAIRPNLEGDIVAGINRSWQ